MRWDVVVCKCTGAKETAQSVKHWPCKREDLRLDPQTHLKVKCGI